MSSLGIPHYLILGATETVAAILNLLRQGPEYLVDCIEVLLPGIMCAVSLDSPVECQVDEDGLHFAHSPSSKWKEPQSLLRVYHSFRNDYISHWKPLIPVK